MRGSLSGLKWCNCTYPVTAGFADIPLSIPLYVPRTIPLLIRSEGRVEHKAQGGASGPEATAGLLLTVQPNDPRGLHSLSEDHKKVQVKLHF